MSSQRAGQLVEAGLFLRLSGDLDGARRLFEQALRLDPTNARARQLLDGAPASPQAPRPVAQPAAPVVPPVGNQAPNRTLQFSPPPVAPGPPAPANPFEAPSAGGAFDADWGMAMDGASADSGWGAPRTTAPAAPMGAPVTTTMAFPLQEARQLPLNQPRAPMGAPVTSTMAFPMAPQPAAEPAPMGAPPTSTMAYPMGPQPAGEPAPMGAPATSTMAYPMQPQPASQPPMPMSTMAFSMAPQPVPELAPMGAPPTSTLAYPMQAQDPGAGHAPHTGWTPPPFPRPHDEVAPAQPAPPEPQGWGAPATSTMAYSMAPQPAGAPDEPWAQPPPDPSSWGQPEAAPPPEAHPGWSGPSGQPEPAGAWGQPEPEPAPAAQGWGAPPTSTLAFPMSPQPPTAAPPVEHDPWAAFKIGTTANPPDTEAAIWNSVALASPEQPPPNYAPPAVHDPFSAPQPPVAENDWSDVRPHPPTPTAPQGVATVAAAPLSPPPEPAPAPTRVAVPTPAPLAPRAASAETVPWDAPGPVEPPPRPRPQPVAFADWAQPTEAPAPRSSGPWSAGDTPEQPMPAPPSAAPAGLQSLAPMLPAPGVAAPIAEPDEIDDIEVVESDDDALVADLEAPPPPPPPPRPLHPFATGIPEPESDGLEGPPGWDDPAMEAAVLDEGDTLDADFSFAPPPPMPAPQAAYVPPPLPVAFAPPAVPAPAPSGPPPIAPGDEPALVTDAQSAWDSNSNPGLKLSSDAAPKKGDPFDLIQKDGQARKAVAPEPDKREVLAGLLRKAKDLIGLDDHTGAMALINQADALAPNDLEVVRLKEKSEATLQRMYESKIGDLNRIPRVKLKETEIIWLNLDHRAGFMLAQVDGASSFEDLFALSGMSRIDTARILAQLIDEGVIVV